MLDGMPVPPPRWERPVRSVRMSALRLDQMLATAWPHMMANPQPDAAMAPYLQMAALRLRVGDGMLEVAATDTRTILRERQLVNVDHDDFTFLLRRDDVSSLRSLLKGVLSGLDKDEKPEEPVDVFLEQAGEGEPRLGVVGDDLDVRFTEVEEPHEFPGVDVVIGQQLDRLVNVGVEPMDLLLDPELLARLVPMQRSGRMRKLRFRWAGERRPVVVRPLTDDGDTDDVVALVGVTRAPEDQG